MFLASYLLPSTCVFVLIAVFCVCAWRVLPPEQASSCSVTEIPRRPGVDAGTNELGNETLSRSAHDLQAHQGELRPGPFPRGEVFGGPSGISSLIIVAVSEPIPLGRFKFCNGPVPNLWYPCPGSYEVCCKC